MKFLIIPVALLLTGCATKPPPTQTIRQLISPATPQAQLPIIDDFQVRVYSMKQLEVMIADAKKTGKDLVIVAMTPEGYKIMVNNLIEIERYIKEQRAIIAFQKKTLDSREKITIPTK